MEKISYLIAISFFPILLFYLKISPNAIPFAKGLNLCSKKKKKKRGNGHIEKCIYFNFFMCSLKNAKKMFNVKVKCQIKQI